MHLRKIYVYTLIAIDEFPEFFRSNIKAYFATNKGNVIKWDNTLRFQNKAIDNFRISSLEWYQKLIASYSVPYLILYNAPVGSIMGVVHSRYIVVFLPPLYNAPAVTEGKVLCQKGEPNIC